MMLLNENNLGLFFSELFDKTILKGEEINFNDNHAFYNILEIFRFDYCRYFNNTEISKENVMKRLELVGILLYRAARYYYLNNMEDSAISYGNLGRLLSGFEIYYSADIGKGLKINHGLGTVIGARCVLGENTLIHQNVTIGDKAGHRPVLGNNIVIYAGAVLLGKIAIGDHVVVGANTVCFIDVPENSTIAGNPAKIIKNKLIS